MTKFDDLPFGEMLFKTVFIVGGVFYIGLFMPLMTFAAVMLSFEKGNAVPLLAAALGWLPVGLHLLMRKTFVNYRHWWDKGRNQS